MQLTMHGGCAIYHSTLVGGKAVSVIANEGDVELKVRARNRAPCTRKPVVDSPRVREQNGLNGDHVCSVCTMTTQKCEGRNKVKSSIHMVGKYWRMARVKFDPDQLPGGRTTLSGKRSCPARSRSTSTSSPLGWCKSSALPVSAPVPLEDKFVLSMLSVDFSGSGHEVHLVGHVQPLIYRV